MFERIYEILVSILGESKQGGFDKTLMQYQFNCPADCKEENGGEVDNKYNLEISLELGKVHCWKCDFKGPISYVIKRFGSKEDLDEYFRIVKEIKESRYYNASLFSDSETKAYLKDYLVLPDTFTKIDLATCRKRKLVEYLKKRGITQDIINYYNIGYTTWAEEKWQMRDRIIIPSYDQFGDLNYWVGRDFSGNPKKMKYWNSKTDKNEIVLHEDRINFDSDIILVEGAIDCIYYPNAIGLMGKVLTKDCEVYQKIVEKANANIIICLDSDTEIFETKRIYRLLDKGRLRGHIFYIRMDKYKDFGEAFESGGKNGIIELMKQQKQFSEIELLV